MSKFKLKNNYPAWLILASLILLNTLIAYYSYPMLDGDSPAYFPIALQYKQGKGLISLFDGFPIKDPKRRLVFQGFFNHIVRAFLSPSPSNHSMRMVLSFEISLCFLLSFIFFNNLFSVKPPSLQNSILIGFSLFPIATFLIGNGGRPEAFSMLLLLMGAISFQHFKNKYSYWISAIFVGLLAASNPLIGLLSGGLLFSIVSVNFYFAAAIRHMTYILLIATSSFFSCFLLYPYPTSDWFEGMLRASKFAVSLSRFDLNGFIYYYFTKPGSTFLGLIWILILICLTFLMIKYQKKIRSPILFLLVIITLLSIMKKTFILDMPRSYNLFVFTPLGISILLWAYNHMSNSKISSIKLYSFFLTLIISFSLSSIGFVREIVLFPVFIAHGLGYSQARQDLKQIRASFPGELILSSGLLPLTEDYSNVAEWNSSHKYASATLVIQQTNIRHPNRHLPPKIPNYKLIINKFSKQTPILLGLKLANTPRGYNYAVYIPQTASNTYSIEPN